MINKIKDAVETREYLIQELKKQIIGPLDGHFTPGIASFQFTPENLSTHKQEVLSKSPRSIYTAGILFPQNSAVSLEENEEEINENISDQEISEIIKDEKSNEKQIETDTEQVADNNFDLDLTNELRASAIGLSIIVSERKNFILGINNMGKYKKLGKEPSENLMLICYFLAREKDAYEWFQKEFNLDNKNNETIHTYIEQLFAVSNIKMKYRDYFDKFFPNREGWKGRTDVNKDNFHEKFKNISRKEIEEKIREFIAIEKNNKQEKKELLDGYARKSISLEVVVKSEDLKKKYFEKKLLFEKENLGLSFFVTVRSHKDPNKKYLTISLVNENKSNKDKILVNKCFFQTNFYIKSENNDKNIFYPFEEMDIESFDDEEKSLNLLHNNRKSYAIGHGCAASWENNHDNLIIKTEIMPVFETKPIKAKAFDDLDLNMKLFSEDITFAINQSRKLSTKYSEWLDLEIIKGKKFSNISLQKISKINTDKCKKTLERILEGISLLEENKDAQRAFKFMNLSMYLQQAHYQIKRYSTKIDYDNELKTRNKGNWRPFQLAFILLNLKSFLNPESDDRKIMDLIWFPTGGGKTEAYLGLTSFIIFLRKILNKDIKGCAVLMRYTLRLLTTQQFQRAASLICACEKIRQENKELLGEEKISLGLWIGKDSTPNKEKEAKDILEEFKRNPKDISKNKFIILNCPWCYHPFVSENEKPKAYKILGKKKQLYYVCPNKSCFFSFDDNSLPITVIDERIYSEPPTLLIGTIDKFASITWLHEAISIFDKFSKPDLIIQDELHLISGPLGSIAGMYEILLNALTEKKIDNKKINAKIIGSTATISRAEKQVRNLYGLECNIFPPQTNQLEDSFFSYEAKNEVGRKYVGLFCPSASSPQITLSRVISTMCLAGNEARIFSKNNSKAYDPYWTHLVYFNSIRELMSGASLLQADVKGNLRGEYFRKGMTKEFMGEFFKDMRRGIYKPAELTSRVQSSAVPQILNDLFIEHNTKRNEALDICLTTNMIQVGVDIPRLALMTIVGQPKMTSEYIQASSRVGRDKDKPGLVITILSPFRPRDRSHYEKFKNYHENLYKFVEPTSITSHSDPVRTRCLHAIVIGLSRLWGETQRMSPDLPSEKLKERIKNHILKYVEMADPDHKEEIQNTEKEINFIFEKWESLKPQEYGKMVPIANQGTSSVLLVPAGSEMPPEGDPIPTLTSMRNVDKECSAIIINKYKGKI